MEQATISKPGEAVDTYVGEDPRHQQAVATLLPVTRQPRDEMGPPNNDSSTARGLEPEQPLVDQSWPMNAENEMEFSALEDRLQGYAPTDLPDRFASLASGMIVPALKGVAERMTALGYECSIESSVDAPFPLPGRRCISPSTRVTRPARTPSASGSPLVNQ